MGATEKQQSLFFAARGGRRGGATHRTSQTKRQLAAATKSTPSGVRRLLASPSAGSTKALPGSSGSTRGAQTPVRRFHVSRLDPSCVQDDEVARRNPQHH